MAKRNFFMVAPHFQSVVPRLDQCIIHETGWQEVESTR
jgi:hypothetical protein